MKIGVIDTDAQLNHDFFKDKKIEVRRIRPGIKIISEENYPFTHAEYVCAAILAENPLAEIILYNIIGNENQKNGILMADSINALVDEGVGIINISLGIEELYSDYFYKICEEAKSKGVLLVAAHSNENYVAYPASFDNVIGVDNNFGKEVNKFFRYDTKNNNISFAFDSMVSYYQLNQKYLMGGNSFLAARITGMLSVYYEEIRNSTVLEYIKKVEKNRVNSIPDFVDYKNNYVICMSNRPKDLLQRRFAKECFLCSDIVVFNEVESFLHTKSKISLENGTFLIDIDNYGYYTNNKKELDRIIINTGILFRKIYTRYPIYSIEERMSLQKEYGLLIEQPYL
ncbi:hypothetical protein acsn021_23730 [Anaerocolumna cellulosilytica]|uniref:Peptidase S8/S53 domain-containing protein n=1 Tax=Anaerocolumna cellulosilytica TaxID=433286 RepID=A0A6S6QW24_9FIRM|nr:S8 family serine peptidase [Anaerocolumna cellulosilytica]MBB5193982.1 hypothetical protein [Anaerocolumna cellulosilytica]BCJ94804.1 hypothetical protein acsn021_23730 [Anaerocolumna cellulosilytica]